MPVEIIHSQNIQQREKWPPKITGKTPFFTRNPRFFAGVAWFERSNSGDQISCFARGQHHLCIIQQLEPRNYNDRG